MPSVIPRNLQCLVIILSAFGDTSQADTTSLKEIHQKIFDLYLPNDSRLSILQRVKRYFYREMMWRKIQDKKEIINLLSDVRDVLPDLSVSQNADLETRRKIFDLRLSWLTMIYGTPLGNDIAGISPKQKKEVHPVTLDLPQTRLILKHSEISHKDGIIDYVIIGSGPAASVIAYTLTQKTPNARVVMIESGPFVIPGSTVTEFDWDLMESRNARKNVRGSIMLRNGYTVGGGTTVNLDLAFSPLMNQIKTKLSLWESEGRLPKDFFHKNQGDWRKLSDAYSWISEMVHTRQIDPSEINPNNQILKKGHPLSQTYQLNARKSGALAKYSATEIFLLPALKQGKLNLISDAKVQKIDFKDDALKVIHIEFQKPLDKPYILKDINHFGYNPEQKTILRAKCVIVSAGTLGSTEILLRSNVDNPNIGRGIVIHPSIGIFGQFDRNINCHEGLSASVYAPGPDGKYFFEAMSADPQFLAAIHPGTGRSILTSILNYRKLGGFGVMQVDNVSNDNRIELNPKTDAVDVYYQISENDKGVLRDALRAGTRIMFEQGAKEVYIPTREFLGSLQSGIFHNFQQADEAIQHLTFKEYLSVLSSAHMQGSNKLGRDPQTAVVSPHFKVWNKGKEVDHFYVCDSSVFPTSVGANPMQSIYTIAKLFADRLLQKQVA